MVIQQAWLANIRSQHKNKKIVLTSGTFDLLHIGHIRYLDTVRSHGDIVVVMLSSDARVKARKGPTRPIIPEADRAQMLDALKVVDYVFIDPATNPPDEIDTVHKKILTELQPDIYATDGPDPRFWGIMDKSKFVIVPRSDGDVSTSAIIGQIANL
jgi:rfaE bifunctional protein nucleotidyltransferase chain/domain